MGKNLNKRKILYVSGTRADYGLVRETLFAVKKNSKLSVEIAVCGMHLMPQFGNTLKEVKQDRFKTHIINAVFENDDKESQAKFIGKFILEFLKKIPEIRPDIIFVQGDRPEMLAAATAGVYLGIPVAHSHGGEVTFTVDEMARHAISKLSHIHFVSTKKSAERLIKMGEDSWRVFITGAPGLDVILKKDVSFVKDIAKKYNLNLQKPTILALYHSVTTEIDKAAFQMENIAEAIREIGEQAIFIYPSADPGAKNIIETIEKYKENPLIKIYQNIPHKDYLSLMKVVGVLVGNSSSGLIEAPSFNLPVVNVGERQQGRERSQNIIDVGHNKEEIKKAIIKVLYDNDFKKTVKQCENPYGDGKAGKRIADILARIKIDKKLLQKQITY